MKQLQMLNIEGLSALLADRVNLETKRESSVEKINQLRLKKEELYQQLVDIESNIADVFDGVRQVDTLLALNKKACVKLISTGSLIDLIV